MKRGITAPSFKKLTINLKKSSASDGIDDEAARAEVLNNHFLLIATVHTHFLHIEIRRLVRGEKNIIVSRVFVCFEHLRHDITPEMIITASGEMAGAKHLLILNILIGYG